MIKKIALFVALLLAGCAHKSNKDIGTLSYLAESREDFMLRFEPTGSPCLDALQINLAYAGCSELRSFQGEEELIYFQCANGSSGATDRWSRSTFVILPTMAVVPDYIHMVCVDPDNVLGVLEK